VLSELLGQLFDPLAPHRLGADDRHLPASLWTEGEDPSYFSHHRVGERVVGLVDDDHVGDLHHSGLERLD